MSIVYQLRSSDLYAYHYTSAKTAIDYVLRDRSLLLGSFAATNDPKESKAWTFRGFRGPIGQTFVDFDFSNAVKASARLACFCSDSPGLTGDHLSDILLRGFSRPRMWAQYAEKHTGVCLVFDRVKLLDAVRSEFPNACLRYGLVDYVDRSSIPNLYSGAFAVDLNLYDQLGPEAYADFHIDRHHRELFFEKLTDWRNEHEWRILVHQVASQCLVHFGDALVGVIHGASTSSDDSKAILKLTDEPSIEHMGIGWSNHAPWYDFQREVWSFGDRQVMRKAGFLRDEPTWRDHFLIRAMLNCWHKYVS